MQLLWIVSLFFALLIALFAVQNTTPVTVSLLVWRIEGVAVAALVLASAALGALLTYLLGLSRAVRQWRRRRESGALTREREQLIGELQARVAELERASPTPEPGPALPAAEPPAGSGP